MIESKDSPWTPIAVSYTHLDVYKRQAVQREMNGCRIIIDLVEFVLESLLYHKDARSHETRVFETPLLER